ncbi:hypothetical protein H1P_3550003 [Hyella patelloides LEGE 07179]|uniref:Uncharacterized protein n=1 Tax=Hyella patelloides LEGE 07179 TaxID=945734 RepID=A0A563VW45_9CYAN|nr:hypothetical protein H1P_3550003 [Hyella patelloides LEGE 07179]
MALRYEFTLCFCHKLKIEKLFNFFWGEKKHYATFTRFRTLSN